MVREPVRQDLRRNIQLLFEHLCSKVGLEKVIIYLFFEVNFKQKSIELLNDFKQAYSFKQANKVDNKVKDHIHRIYFSGTLWQVFLKR